MPLRTVALGFFCAPLAAEAYVGVRNAAEKMRAEKRKAEKRGAGRRAFDRGRGIARIVPPARRSPENFTCGFSAATTVGGIRCARPTGRRRASSHSAAL